MPKEYLLTNGLGGYSSADMQLGNTRKYHGLLVISDQELNRFVVVNRLLEEFQFGDKVQSISTNIYRDTTSPSGHIFLESTQNKLSPSWVYRLDGATVTKQIQMLEGENAVVVSYLVEVSAPEVVISVQPMITYRSFHHNSHPEVAAGFPYSQYDESLKLDLPSNRHLWINHLGWEFSPQPDIYYNFFYPVEDERGYSASEDLFTPGAFKARLATGSHLLQLHFSVNNSDRIVSYDLSELQVANSASFKLDCESFTRVTGDKVKPFTELLLNQGRQFRVEVANQPSVIAGYHWFGDWGRDSFISFKGLYLLVGRNEEAKRLLLRWNHLFKDGLLPNRPFEQDYNSVDAIFWYANAVWEYFQATKDASTVAEILPNLHQTHTTFAGGNASMRIREDGLLEDTNVGKSATWMDANINGFVVTDRSGLAVEIQMLWFNFLQVIIDLVDQINSDLDISKIKSSSQMFEQNFSNLFWNPEHSCFYDVIKDGVGDEAIRPNQLVGLYLPFNAVPSIMSINILDVVERELLTEVGLRTLNQDHSNYKGYYGGSQEQRDHAYHQGTIWPFLLGFYLIAHLKQRGFSAESKEYVAEKLILLEAALAEAGIDYVPEIYSPLGFKPEGCISQAWSAALLLETIAALESSPKP